MKQRSYDREGKGIGAGRVGQALDRSGRAIRLIGLVESIATTCLRRGAYMLGCTRYVRDVIWLLLPRQTKGIPTTAIEKAVTGDSDSGEKSSQTGSARIMVQG